MPNRDEVSRSVAERLKIDTKRSFHQKMSWDSVWDALIEAEMRCQESEQGRLQFKRMIDEIGLKTLGEMNWDKLALLEKSLAEADMKLADSDSERRRLREALEKLVSAVGGDKNMNWFSRKESEPKQELTPDVCQCDHGRNCHERGVGPCHVGYAPHSEENDTAEWTACACQIFIKDDDSDDDDPPESPIDPEVAELEKMLSAEKG